MVVVRVMQTAVDQIVDVIAVRDWLVAAARPVRMTAANIVRRAAHGVRCVDCYGVLVDVVFVHVVQMAVMQVVDMAGVTNRRVSASRTMLMGMAGMVYFGAIRHDFRLAHWWLTDDALGYAPLADGTSA